MKGLKPSDSFFTDFSAFDFLLTRKKKRSLVKTTRLFLNCIITPDFELFKRVPNELDLEQNFTVLFNNLDGNLSPY